MFIFLILFYINVIFVLNLEMWGVEMLVVGKGIDLGVVLKNILIMIVNIEMI